MPEHENPTKSFFLLKKSTEPEIGFTTGTCAAASTVAAVRMLLTGETVPYVILTTPKGIKVSIEISDQNFSEEKASCSVRKFSGTDPDVTNGIKIFSSVRKISNASGEIKISGGRGVGRVTLPGLDQNVGEAAINRVPRQMIIEGIRTELNKFCKEPVSFGISVEISVPEGKKIAKQTFNPKLGIVGGISILGTSGIVEPMSEQALLDTIKLEINVRKSQGFRILSIVPGNYGADFLKEEFDFSIEKAVHCSNFVYDSLVMAKNAGFRKILFCGHIGKLVKVAGGIKNTHSKYGDHRMEIITRLAKKFVSAERFLSLSEEIMKCISTEQAVKVLDSLGGNHETRDKIMMEMASQIQSQMREWTSGDVEIEVVIFTKEHGLLAETAGVRDLLKLGV